MPGAALLQIRRSFPTALDLQPGSAFLRTFWSGVTLVDVDSAAYEYRGIPSILSLKTVASGSERYAFGRRSARLTAGFQLITGESGSYSTRCETDRVRELTIFWGPGLVASAKRSLLVPGELTSGFDALVEPLAPTLYRALASMSGASPERALDLAYELLAEVIHRLGARRGAIGRLPAKRSGVRQELYRRASLARAALHEEPAREWRLDELAAIACLSPFHLQRVFKSAFGTTPRDYGAALRMERARRLLAASGCPVGEIAASCGYAAVSAFSRSFRKLTGLSPSEYRRLHGAGL